MISDDDGYDSIKRYKNSNGSYLMYPTSNIPFEFGGAAMNNWNNPFLGEVFEREFGKKIEDIIEMEEKEKEEEERKETEIDVEKQKEEEEKEGVKKISTLTIEGLDDELSALLASTTLDE